MKYKQSQTGFTIVELLIVIVVIAVLAAITTVAYTGIQKRAYNAQVLSATRSYQTTLSIYVAANEAYPDFNGAVCLGTGYADVNGDSVGDCGDINSGEMVSEQTAFNDQLRTVMSDLPKSVNRRAVTTFSGNPWVGITLTKWNEFLVDGRAAPLFIKFILEGSNENCGPGVVSVRPGSTYPDMVTGIANNTWWDQRSTTCVMTLKNA